MTVLQGWFSLVRSEEGSKEKRGSLALMLSIGPISLFATLSAAFLRDGNLDLAIAAAAGIYLCFSLSLRGFFYSLLLLFLSAFPKHLFFLESHFWQMGIEISMALGFVVCALSAIQLLASREAAEAKIESQSSALSNLEEEASRRGQEALEEKISLQSRLSELQKELDEAQSELSTLRILNDVVRKSSVKQEEADARDAAKERRIAELLQEIEELHCKEVSYEKAELLQELNAARVEREQTILINETLVRMHASADRRAKELSVQNEHLQEQIQALLQIQKEKEELAKEQEETRLQLANLMQERIAAESEKLQWNEQLSEKDRTIALFQERICALSETQALYFQLKKQFEEKNTVLHQTRQELFRAETALGAAQIEKKWEEVEFPFFESMLAKEVVLLENEKLSLENENADLAEIIGLLSKSPKSSPASPKKKKKKPSEESSFWEMKYN